MPDDIITQLLAAKRIAVVGMSEGRISGRIGQFLKSHGREVLPVNPSCDSVYGMKTYNSLADVPGRIDLVNVFRRPEFCADVVRDAIAVKAGGVWLHSGIVRKRPSNSPGTPAWRSCRTAASWWSFPPAYYEPLPADGPNRKRRLSPRVGGSM